jgi:Cu(I)/Ag(I) efflux system membrane fusion protein
MEMVAVESVASGEGDDPHSIALSPRARQLAAVEVAPVERRSALVDLRLFGKVDLDETRVRMISARVAGRLDRLFVDYTGVRVKKGDHLISLYSPELLTAQEELLQAVRGIDESNAIGIIALRDAAVQALHVARSKLTLWGLTQEQLKEIQDRGTASDHITVFAPIGGVVLEKPAVEGMYVEMGDRLFSIADLSVVWLKLEAYESDLPFIRYGQEVNFTADALPGESFQGTVAFVDPRVDPKTRTVRVRVNVSNPSGRFLPDMFVRGRVHAEVTEDGAVYSSKLARKWISPMHPEVVRDEPGTCDVCGMPLVSAESLGYASSDAAAKLPLIVPRTAVLLTGERAIVYVEEDGGAFSARQIELGGHVDGGYIVRSGLHEGERIAVSGTLRLDSAAQIQSRPSMMKPRSAEESPAGKIERVPLTSIELEALGQVLDDYFRLHDALAHDRGDGALGIVTEFRAHLNQWEGERAPTTPAWRAELAHIRGSVDELVKVKRIQDVRKVFQPLSDVLIRCVRTFGVPGAVTLHMYHCPMAFDNRGADWLQNKTGLENPYYGAEMFTCGVLKESWRPINTKGGE